MPVRSKSSSTAVARPSILLLEEYDALAAAITSALRKFAPKHAHVVARSLAQAEKLASDVQPELFVLDVDPPWRGLTNFLEKMSETYPNARAVVIGAQLPTEIISARGASGAVQFIEKPFELAAFGATVQALLGPWREMEGRGTLRGLGVLDVVLAHCAANASVIVDVRSGRRTAEIHITGGQVVHAATGKLKGEGALDEILNWSKAHFSERKLGTSAHRTIANWRAIALANLSEAESDIAEERAPEPEIPAAKAGKKIVVVDDTEMLVIFVEDILTTADSQLQLTTAFDATSGLREIEREMPDLVLLDYSLPDLNGDELCERLLQNPRTARVPVLLMSGHVSEMNAAAARLPNIVAKIEKPFLSEAFVDLVQRTLATEHKFEPRAVERKEREPTVIPEPEPLPPPLPPPPPPPPVPIPPPQKQIVREPAPRPIPPPTLAPVQSHIERHAPIAAPTVRVAPADGNAALLGIFLEVVSMQLTSQLQMGAIRARPSSLTASLQLESATARNAIPSELGFQLGPIKLDGEGRISALRLIPTLKPFQPRQTRSAFEIGGVALVPNEPRGRVQLTPAGTTPMTVELFAQLELDSVELSGNFQVAQLILNWNANNVRVTLNPKAPAQSAAKFDLRVLKLDNAGRIAELLLRPIR